MSPQVTQVLRSERQGIKVVLTESVQEWEIN